MQPHETVSEAIRAANAAGRTALVPFITAGYPEPDTFIDTLEAVAEQGDVVEIGIPFSDPMADGMTIQRSSFKAIENGVTLSWIFDTLKKAGRKSDTPYVMMSYMNPLLAYGYDRLTNDALETGVSAFIVPDLPFEESEELRKALNERGVGLIQLVTPATPPERLEMLSNASQGFVYAVTITGITGGSSGLPADLAGYLDGVRRVSPLPVCAGFGIRAASDVANVGQHANGAIVGSALVEVLERGDDPQAFLAGLGG